MRPIAVLALLAAPHLAVAQSEPPQPAQPPADTQHSISLTFSPIHLAIGIFEATGEFRVYDKLGIAIIGGGGSIENAARTESFSAAELGGQVRYYALGSFEHGLQLGAEALYLRVDAETVDVTGSGLSVGPFIGYKIAANIGFTFDAQLGTTYVVVEAHNGAGASASDAKWLTLLNLNVGWSF